MATVSGSLNDSQDIEEFKTRCHWAHVLNEQTFRTLEKANFDAGLITLAIGLWLNCTILMSGKLRNEKGYRNFLNYTISSTLRRGIPILFWITPFRCFAKCIKDVAVCQYLAYLGSLIAIFEIESLAQVCIERFINALYKYKGWHVPEWHNSLFPCLSTLLAFIYSTLPIAMLGYSIYGIDFDCKNCTFNTLLPQEAAYKIIIIIILVLKSLKPVLVMIFSLNYARWMEFNKLQKREPDTIDFTYSICVVVVVNIICWFPLFMVHSTIILTQLLFANAELIWSPCFISWAISMHWIAPAFAMLSFVCCNERVQNKMVNLVYFRSVDSDEPILPKEMPSMEVPPKFQPTEEKVAANTK